MEKFKISVFCEIQRNNTAAKVSFELASKAAELALEIDNSEVTAIIIGKRINYDNIIEELSRCGVNKVTVINDDVFENYSPERYRKAFCDILQKEKPDIVLIGATCTGREIAPLVATTLNTGLTADCTELEIIDGKLAATRPTFGGKMNATILCKTLPQMATVRPSVFKIKKIYPENEAEVRFDWIDTNDQPKYTELINYEPFKKICSLNDAQIIVSGGKGLKTKENFNKLYELAELLNAAAGASRGAVEAKLAPPEIQIGQTGKTVNAKIYIAFGISGMAQHIAGINSCDTIIAVNNNPNAPIFKIANYGIVGDANNIISEMIDKIKNK